MEFNLEVFQNTLNNHETTRRQEQGQVTRNVYTIKLKMRDLTLKQNRKSAQKEHINFPQDKSLLVPSK